MNPAGAPSDPAASFEPYRRRLLGLAYWMLGSMADAEDAVQDAYLRWQAADRERVSDPGAFLLTTTTRICIDLLTSARARREQYVGSWLPEPVVDTAGLAAPSSAELAEDLSIALLLTLDRLSPLERAAFLLHDVFDFPFSEVGATLERSAAACRQLAARARAHVRALRPGGSSAPLPRSGELETKHEQLMSAFMARARQNKNELIGRVCVHRDHGSGRQARAVYRALGQPAARAGAARPPATNPGASMRSRQGL